MSKPADDLEAVRMVVEAVQGFDKEEQQRIFRWAAEKLGLPQTFGTAATLPSVRTPADDSPPISPPPTPPPSGSSQDIKSFVAARNPRSDVQFAATVAYYYQFVAPPSEKKIGITKEDLVDAIRKVGGRKIPPHPDMTLNNTYQAGLLDRPEKGVYAINSVGENLVTMTLPGDGSTAGGRKKAGKKPPTKIAKRKATVRAKA